MARGGRPPFGRTSGGRSAGAWRPVDHNGTHWVAERLGAVTVQEPPRMWVLSVGDLPGYGAALRQRRRGDPLSIEHGPGGEISRGQPGQAVLVTVAVEEVNDVLGAQRALPRPWVQPSMPPRRRLAVRTHRPGDKGCQVRGEAGCRHHTEPVPVRLIQPVQHLLQEWCRHLRTESIQWNQVLCILCPRRASWRRAE
jgi:hypothetical protein